MGQRLSKDTSEEVALIKNHITTNISEAIQTSKEYYKESYISTDEHHIMEMKKFNNIPQTNMHTISGLIIKNIQKWRCYSLTGNTSGSSATIVGLLVAYERIAT
jgi:hypothetical protein